MRGVLGVPEHKLRVIAPDVGGGFGSKIFLYPEETVITWAAKLVNRPVKWTAERAESFMADAHGRDHVTTAELAPDKDGRIPFVGTIPIDSVPPGEYSVRALVQQGNDVAESETPVTLVP